MKHTTTSIAQELLDDHPAELHFDFGWTAYEDGSSILDLDTDEQRDGWLAAAELQDLIDGVDDQDFFRRGC